MNIRDRIVAILNSDGKIIGTGFLAGPGLIATCAHVAAQAEAVTDGDPVTVRFDGQSQTLTARLAYWRDVDKGDVAVFRLDSPRAGLAPLPLGRAAASVAIPKHTFSSYGYASVVGVQGIGAHGTIVEIIDNGRLVQLTSQEPDHGMSGAPVLDEQRGVVIGMVTKGKGRRKKTTSCAISSPPLPPAVTFS